MKKWIAVMLALVLMLPLFGCNTQPVGTDPTTTGTSGSTPSTTAPNLSQGSTYPTRPWYNSVEDYFEIDPQPERDDMLKVQYLPEEVENPQNFPILKWVYTSYATNSSWSEAAAHEVNEMLAEKNMPFQLQFVILKMDTDWYTNTRWFDLPRVQEILADADLISGWMGPDERQEYLMPITEYAAGEAEPSLENAVLHKLNWLNGSASGEIYGIPSMVDNPTSIGWQVKAEFLDKMGLTAEDFDRQLWEMDELFAQIYKKNGNEPFFYIEKRNGARSARQYSNIGSVWPYQLVTPVREYQYIGACYGIDLIAGKPSVVNTMEQEEFRKIRLAIRRYSDAGYIVEGTKDMPASELAQILYTSVIGEEIWRDTNGGVHIPVSAAKYSYGYALSNSCGVAASSVYWQEALMLLNLVAEDEAFRDHLFFGKEGRDYTLVDGVYSRIEQEDGSRYRMEYLSGLYEFSSVLEKNSHLIYTGKPVKEFYLECMESADVVEYPIIFDYTGFEAELVEMGDLLGQLLYKYTEWTEEEYDGYLQKLKDAGSEKIQAELQRQLDEWLAANPDWLEWFN